MPCIGRATHKAVFSVYSNAIDFGINSPKTTCKNVIKQNATVTETECVAMVCPTPGIKLNSGFIIFAKVASPTQPKPILEIVTPN